MNTTSDPRILDGAAADARLVLERAHAALQEREHQMRLVTEHIPAKIAYFDAELRCRFANTAYCEFYQIGPQAILGMPLREISGENTWCAISLLIERVKRGEHVVAREARTTADGVRHAEVHRVPDMAPGGGFRGYYAMLLDITEQKCSAQQIEYLSNHDALTRLPNRALFHDRLKRAAAHARRRGETVGVILLNADRFSRINESLGNAAGDELLREIGARLTTALRDVDTIARLGGNDFAVLIEGITTDGDITRIADKLLELMVAPFTAGGQEIHVSVSIGIAFYPGNTGDSSALLTHAEAAMRQAKRDGGSACALYEGQQTPRRSPRLELERGLRRALENGELSVHFQPKVTLADGKVNGVEALLRWMSPSLGSVDPSQFIPIAEESGLIIPIGAWVLRTACAQVAAWRRDGHAIGIAVNLSPRQFRHKNLLQDVAEALAATGLAAPHLELEITEGTAMSHAEYTIRAMAGLKQLGVKLAVDDFGTGYSSLAYLRSFPLDCLKIDRSFVQDIQSDASSEKIVHATLALAHSLRLKVVAEGVETEGQRDFLAAAGCDEGQGYLFGRALSADDFRKFLGDTRNAHATSTVETE